MSGFTQLNTAFF